jgi:hypothetical protein
MDEKTVEITCTQCGKSWNKKLLAAHAVIVLPAPGVKLIYAQSAFTK